MKKSTYGFIYMMTTPSSPGYVKVGKTRRTPDQRAVEMSIPTGVPTPYNVVWFVFVNNCHTLEKLAHQKLHQYRVSKNKEFFKISEVKCKEILKKTVEGNTIDGIDQIPDIPPEQKTTTRPPTKRSGEVVEVRPPAWDYKKMSYKEFLKIKK